jgi:hypothetical protein
VGGDPINSSDPFGLCPYEGEVRTTSLTDCKDVALKPAFQLLLADPGLEGRQAVMLIMAANINVVLSSGPVQCGSVLTTECTNTNLLQIKVDGSRSPAGIASDIVHGASHMDVPPGMNAMGEELNAWNRALNFYDRLPTTLRIEKEESDASTTRKNNPKEFTLQTKLRAPT